jgi:hypothetical protein
MISLLLDPTSPDPFSVTVLHIIGVREKLTAEQLLVSSGGLILLLPGQSPPSHNPN